LDVPAALLVRMRLTTKLVQYVPLENIQIYLQLIVCRVHLADLEARQTLRCVKYVRLDSIQTMAPLFVQTVLAENTICLQSSQAVQVVKKGSISLTLERASVHHV